MANRRQLKKELNYICSELFAECIAASSYSGRTDAADNTNAILKRILHTHSDYTMRVSHPEPGMKPKVYFKKMKDSFNNDITDIVDQIGNMLS